jgi:hypothetical protein
MTKRASTKEELEHLHFQIGRYLNNQFEEAHDKEYPLDGATLGHAIAFVTKNNITIDPADRGQLTDLRKNLAAEAAAREAAKREQSRKELLAACGVTEDEE